MRPFRMWRCLNVERSNKGPTNPQVDIFSLSGKGDEMRSARSPPFLYRISIHTTSVYNLHFEACFCLGILRAVLRGRGTVCDTTTALETNSIFARDSCEAEWHVSGWSPRRRTMYCPRDIYRELCLPRVHQGSARLSVCLTVISGKWIMSIIRIPSSEYKGKHYRSNVTRTCKEAN